MYKFNIGDLVVKSVDDGRNIRAVYGIVLKTRLSNPTHDGSRRVFVRWQRGGKKTWVIPGILMMVAEAKKNV